MELLRTTNSAMKMEMEQKDAKVRMHFIPLETVEFQITELEESLNSLVNNNNEMVTQFLLSKRNKPFQSLTESMELMELMEKENEEVCCASEIELFGIFSSFFGIF